MTNILSAAQMDVLDAVSDALELVLMHDEPLFEDVLYEANRRLREDGHPFEFYRLGPQVSVREVK